MLTAARLRSLSHRKVTWAVRRNLDSVPHERGAACTPSLQSGALCATREKSDKVSADAVFLVPPWYQAEPNQSAHPRKSYRTLHSVPAMRRAQPVGRVQPHPIRRHERSQHAAGIAACRMHRLDLRGLTAGSDAGVSAVRPCTRAARRRRSFAPQRAMQARTGSPPPRLTPPPAPPPPRRCAGDTRPGAAPAAAPRDRSSPQSSAPSPAR